MKYYYPNRIIQSSGENSVFVEFNDLDNIKSPDDSFAITDEIESKSGKKKRPSIIRATYFNCDVALNSKISEITVELGQEYVGDLTLDKLAIKLLNVDGKLKSTELDYNEKIMRTTFKVNCNANDINTRFFGVNINFPSNSSENPGYLKLHFLRISISYELENKNITKLKRISHNLKTGYGNLKTSQVDGIYKLYYIFQTYALTKLDFLKLKDKKSFDDNMKEFMLEMMVNGYEDTIVPDFENALKKRDSYKGWKLKFIKLDFLLCYVFLGAIAENYFSLTFEKKGWAWRNHHVTHRRYTYIVNKINHDSQSNKVIEDKANFCKIWNDSLHREWCNPSETSINQFKEQFKDIERIIVKPITDRGGYGIRLFDAEKTSLEDIFKWATSQPQPCLIEEYHNQTGWLHEINASSLNTIRVATVKVNEKTDVIFSCLRTGVKDSFVDNLHSGGIRFPVDHNTGKIYEGMNFEIMDVEKHPDSGIKLAGETVPRWDEILTYCKKAHELAPENLHLIGWDICLDEDEISLIEANRGPGFPPITNPKENLWKQMKQYLVELENMR